MEERGYRGLSVAVHLNKRHVNVKLMSKRKVEFKFFLAVVFGLSESNQSCNASCVYMKHTQAAIHFKQDFILLYLHISD